jgi:hypothetical protein
MWNQKKIVQKLENGCQLPFIKKKKMKIHQSHAAFDRQKL